MHITESEQLCGATHFNFQVIRYWRYWYDTVECLLWAYNRHSTIVDNVIWATTTLFLNSSPKVQFELPFNYLFIIKNNLAKTELTQIHYVLLQNEDRWIMTGMAFWLKQISYRLLHIKRHEEPIYYHRKPIGNNFHKSHRPHSYFNEYQRVIED